MAFNFFGKLNIINNNKSKNSFTVMSVNLCYESDLKGISRVNYWFKKFIECHHKYGVNVIIMQEVLDDIINLPLLLVQKLKKWNVVLNNHEEHTLIITTLSINNKKKIKLYTKINQLTSNLFILQIYQVLIIAYMIYHMKEIQKLIQWMNY